MVSTASASAQAGEIEKKRKQTLERAKSTHLSRQLQMRLQYARLKVEHGWQKQNLNEVENLYFHHSHQRGPKPYLTSSSILSATDTSSISSPSKFSDPSYRAWLNTLSRSSTLDTLMDASNQENAQSIDALGIGASMSTESSVEALPGSYSDAVVRPANAEHTSSLVSQNSTTSTTLAQTPTQSFQAPYTQNGVAVRDNSELSSLISQNTVSTPSTSVEPASSTSSLPSQPHLPMSLPFAAGANNTAPTTASTSKIKKPIAGNKNTSLTTKDMFDFNSASLTYDSFWSGLQSKPYPVRTGGASTTAAKGLTGASTGVSPNGATSATSFNSRALAMNSNPIFAQQNLGSTSAPIPPPSLPSASPHPQSPSASKPITSSLVPAQMPSFVPSSSHPLPSTASSSANTPPTSMPQPQLLETQDRLLDDNLSAWTFSPAQHPGALVLPQDLIPASLLSNPAAFPFFANLSASYLQTLNGNAGQVHLGNAGGAGVDGTGAGTTGAGVTSQSVSIPTPTHAPPALSAFVGQQES